MDIQPLSTIISDFLKTAQDAADNPHTYVQILIILCLYAVSFIVAHKIKQIGGLTRDEGVENSNPARRLAFKTGGILFPLLAIILLKITKTVGESLTFSPWLINLAFAIAIILFFNSLNIYLSP